MDILIGILVGLWLLKWLLKKFITWIYVKPGTREPRDWVERHVQRGIDEGWL